MFDAAGLVRLATAADAAVVAIIEDSTRAEASAAAARLAAIAELAKRRVVEGDDREYWACDCWDSAAAEVAAAMGVAHRSASREMRIGLALRDRLPSVAALYAEGRLSSKVVSTITWRTRLVDDENAVALIDAAIAGEAIGWGTSSGAQVERAVDFWVDRFDPGALVRTAIAARDHDFRVGGSFDTSGTTTVWGRLSTTNAEVLRRRLVQMLDGVCVNDPRTAAQQRAQAIAEMAMGAERLACRCGASDCPRAGIDAAAAAVTIHVIADEAAVAAEPTGSPDEKVVAPRSAETRGSAVMTDGHVVPTPLLAELIGHGATVLPVRGPGDDTEKSYRPSARLARFVRTRDMTCRFPGCGRPAELTDLDHTVPYPTGATHASNAKCLCRLHHLLKTFWVGANGWADRQLPDGTVVWTSPSGRTYATAPGSRLFFPQWNTTTAELPQGDARNIQSARGVMMPTRRRTRARDRAQRVKAQRALNDAYVAHRREQPP